MKKTIIIGIAGASASGKSLMANTLLSELGSEQVVVISEDSYYKDTPNLSDEARQKINLDHPDAFDHDLLAKHLAKLKEGKSIEVPTYDHANYCRLPQTRKVAQSAIIILEGILLFYESNLRKLMDIRIFMDTPLDICLVRRLRRDIIERQRSVESVLSQYENTVRPMYLQFVEPSKRHADIIIPRGGENRIAIDMIKAKMRELLSHSA